jgi:four helix bundle protein
MVAELAIACQTQVRGVRGFGGSKVWFKGSQFLAHFQAAWRSQLQTRRKRCMTAIRSHEELDAWRLSDALEDRVYEITSRPAARTDFDFCDDARRAARSAPANLAEGFHRYRPRDNARFVRIAIGSLGETMNHLRHAWKRKYITDEEHRDWVVLAKRARGASTSWLAYLDSCPPDGPEPKTKP